MESNQWHAAGSTNRKKKPSPCRNVASDVKLTGRNVSSLVKKKIKIDERLVMFSK